LTSGVATKNIALVVFAACCLGLASQNYLLLYLAKFKKRLISGNLLQVFRGSDVQNDFHQAELIPKRAFQKHLIFIAPDFPVTGLPS
jgi:hypothetical protein